jgi:hypothetical protein
MKLLSFSCTILLISICLRSMGQGSSDPGFSMAGSLGELSSHLVKDSTAKKHSMRITESVGMGEDNVVVISSNLDVYLQLTKWLQFQIRGPIFMARHKEVKTVTIGDIFLIYDINALKIKQHSLIVNGGVKLPTNQSRLTYNDSTLPMVYQSSLGTFDLILGLNYTWTHKLGSLSGAFAYQQPFFHINHNKSPETKEFRRKADILFRADQIFNIKKKVDMGIGLLYILHANNDTRINALGQREAIAGSKGSTLNITGMLNWYVAKTVELGFNFGVPVLKKDISPDGLKRAFVINPYLQFNF